MSQKLEVTDCPSLYDAVDAIVNEMENNGLRNSGLDVPICVILKSTGEVRNGQRVMNALAYIDASDNEIIDDLEGD